MGSGYTSHSLFAVIEQCFTSDIKMDDAFNFLTNFISGINTFPGVLSFLKQSHPQFIPHLDACLLAFTGHVFSLHDERYPGISKIYTEALKTLYWSLCQVFDDGERISLCAQVAGWFGPINIRVHLHITALLYTNSASFQVDLAATSTASLIRAAG